MTLLTGWRYVCFVGVIIGGTAAALYPIVIQPMIDPGYYKQIQKQNRAGVRQEDVQPGNMKVWSDPFDRKADDSKH